MKDGENKVTVTIYMPESLRDSVLSIRDKISRLNGLPKMSVNATLLFLIRAIVEQSNEEDKKELVAVSSSPLNGKHK